MYAGSMFERDLLPIKKVKFICLLIGAYTLGFCIKTVKRDYMNEARKNLIKRDLARVK